MKQNGTTDHSYTQQKIGSFQSQHGEDRWIDRYFLGKSAGFFIEIGAYDGIVLSNSYFFEKERNWTGILVEPDANKAAMCRLNRPASSVFECAAVASSKTGSISFTQVVGGEVYSTVSDDPSHLARVKRFGLESKTISVKAMTMDEMLTQAKVVEGTIDFVTIDVEEAELDVLKGFSIKHWRPKLVVVESNGGQRKTEIRDYFVGNGYSYLHSIEVNHFYAPAVGGPLVVRLTDYYRYRLSRGIAPIWRELTASGRRLLDRHILWRFRR